VLISFLAFALLGAFTILQANGSIVYGGCLIGLAILHAGVWKRNRGAALIGIVAMGLSFFLPMLLMRAF